jgi:hypothetical protein
MNAPRNIPEISKLAASNKMITLITLVKCLKLFAILGHAHDIN